MIETITTKQIPEVFPILKIWGWDVAFYLFMGGIAAGLMLFASAAVATRAQRFLPTACGRLALLDPVMLGIGMLGLFHHLGNRWNVMAFYLFFNPVSPMGWGAWALPVLMGVGGLFGLACLPPEDRGRVPFAPLRAYLEALTEWREPMAKAAVPLALFLGSYTGVLLSTRVAAPLELINAGASFHDLRPFNSRGAADDAEPGSPGEAPAPAHRYRPAGH